MTAYYNENDPFAANWLRELIKANLIAPGDVDERSIEDVTPNDVAPYTVPLLRRNRRLELRPPPGRVAR